MGNVSTALAVVLVIVTVGLALHYFGGEVLGWMASLHGPPPSH